LIDFGLAKNNSTTETIQRGNEVFKPPEFDDDDYSNPKSDIWSFGCLMYSVLYPAFNTKQRLNEYKIH